MLASILSAPAPPVTTSAPALSLIVSSPAPDKITSASPAPSTVSSLDPNVIISAPAPPVILNTTSASANAVSPVKPITRSLTLMLPSPLTSSINSDVPSLKTKSPATPPRLPGASAVLATSPLSVSVNVIPPAARVSEIFSLSPATPAAEVAAKSVIVSLVAPAESPAA